MKNPALAILAACSLAGCSSQATAPDDATTRIVTSTPIWADVAEVVAHTSEHPVDIQSVITDPNVDPHHYEASAADVAHANDADRVIVGGGGYDAWLYKAISDQDKVITALPLIEHGTLAEHADESAVPVIDGNEHIWYDVDAINAVGKQISQAIPGSDAGELEKLTKDYQARVQALPARKFAQTEPIADYLLSGAPWTDVTPAGYRASTLKEGEPSAADLARFLKAIQAGEVEVLIYNPQTKTDMTDRIYNAARDAGIPIIEIGETPLGGENFFDYYESVIADLEQHA